MLRIRAAFLAMLLGLSGFACGNDPAPVRHPAPGQGVLPSAGKATQPDDGNEAGAAALAEGGAGGAPGASASGGSAGAAPDAGAPPDDGGVGSELRIEVSADTPTFVSLASASRVDVGEAERASSSSWDLVFRGWDIFTNGGASGGGKGAAFGPLPFTYFLAGTEPTEVPFLIEDKAAGAFRAWYFYDGQWHALYSRFHCYGVKSGERLFKLQVLGYYGDVQGAPISALYHLRYAQVTSSERGTVSELSKLDATAGGLGGNDGAPNGVLSLGTGAQQQLTPDERAKSTLWDLSFRRDSISINGGLGGPGAVTAVDLDADKTEGETLDVVKVLTAENQAAAFAAVDYAALTKPALKYRGDRIVSAFSDAWADTSAEPPRLTQDNTWLVAGADGTSRFLLGVTAIENSTTAAAGTVVVRIRKVR